MSAHVVFVATYDTKGEESQYIKQRITMFGASCTTVDVGVGQPPGVSADITLKHLCEGSAYTPGMLREMPRGNAVQTVTDLAVTMVQSLFEAGELDCIVGVGGAGGTQIVTACMRALPFGVPKLMLSTMAGETVSWYVGDSDLCMMPSVVDVAGLNPISTPVFDRFAALAAQGALWYKSCFSQYDIQLRHAGNLCGMSMYGTTTKGVTAAKAALQKRGYDSAIFHASGAGGRAMENFVSTGAIKGVLDMTMAEIGGHLVGGLHDAGPNRMAAMVQKGIPYVVVPGAADTVVLPPAAQIPAHLKEGRVLNMHNPTMTTLRTNVEENIAIGQFIVEKLKSAGANAKVIFPTGGLSSIDLPGQVFYNPKANQALFDTIEGGLLDSGVEILYDSRHICDPQFGQFAAGVLADMMDTH